VQLLQLHPRLFFKDAVPARPIPADSLGVQGAPISMLMASVSLHLFTAEVSRRELPLNVEMGHIASVATDAAHAHIMEV
jgi:hypothetical protein